MDFRDRDEHAASKISDLLNKKPSSDQAKALADAIEREIIKAVLEESHRCVDVAGRCCSPDQDKAHKIAEEIRRTHNVLTANLSSLR